MTEPDERLRHLYGTLPREEPPAALDAAVLAAARRAVAPPSLARRWGAPVAVAAMLVLVVGVTLEMQREEPGIETSITPSAPPPAPAPEAVAPKAAVPQAVAPAEPAAAPKAPAETRAKPAMKAKAMPRPQLREPVPVPAPAPRAEEAPRAAQDAPQAPSAPPAAREAAPEAKRTAPFADALESAVPPRASPPAPAARSASGGVAANLSLQKRAVAEAPDAELERIAKLRADGKDAEADRALDAFRREHPGYRIDDAMWERVKPRER